jgi:glycolate oxidase
MITSGLLKEFRSVVGSENVLHEEADLLTYSYDAAVLKPVQPALVLRPDSSQALGGVVKLCYENGLPLTVRGSGTNLSGGTIPSAGGVVVLTGWLNKILEINEADMYAVVQPGVVTARFAAKVAEKGLFYPPDPGSMAVSTLGGNVAENSGGLRGLKYGVTRDYVMALEYFDSQGGLIKTGAKTVKCVTGYNLASLMIGSEGTLGVLSSITLKLIPPPAANRAMIATFDSMQAASQTVAEIIAARIVPATLEYMDNFTIRAVEDYAGAGLPTEAAALLLIEVDGHPAQVADEAARVEELCRAQGATGVQVARDEIQRTKVWEARRTALSALARLEPTVLLEDATVPRSRIPEMIDAVNRVADRFDLKIGIFGHAGDGNLHPTILTDSRDSRRWQAAEGAVEAIFDIALELGGTLSGEHGIGLAKSRFLKREANAATIEWSRRMKSALDPKGILNPGKIIGDPA